MEFRITLRRSHFRKGMHMVRVLQSFYKGQNLVCFHRQTKEDWFTRFIKNNNNSPFRSPGSRQTVSPLEHLYKNHHKLLCYINSNVLLDCSIINHSFNNTTWHLFKYYCTNTTLQCFCLHNFYFTIKKSTVY